MLDVDGVLVHGRPADGKHWQRGLRADLGIDPDALHAAFFAPYWDDIVVGRADLFDRLAPILATLAPHVAPTDFVAYWFAHDARVDTRLLPVLAEARAAGVRVLLATNQEHHRARHLMETLDLRAHVDGMLASAAIGARKPHAAFFERAQQAVALPADALLLVDDSFANVEAAREAGWQALHWTPALSPETLHRALA
jgi:putative hydrolase of the HAD superfamily